MQPRILAFAGSARRESFNKKLLANAVSLLGGAEVTCIDLAHFEMPVYNGDLEERDGLPEAVRKLKALMREHDRYLIASPEYNSSITPLLKNVIDWCSRPETDDEPSLQAFDGKGAGLLSASPGGLGGLRGLRHVREILGNLGVYVVPAQFALSRAGQAFDDEGKLTSEEDRKRLGKVVDQLVNLRIS